MYVHARTCNLSCIIDLACARISKQWRVGATATSFGRFGRVSPERQNQTYISSDRIYRLRPERNVLHITLFITAKISPRRIISVSITRQVAFLYCAATRSRALRIFIFFIPDNRITKTFEAINLRTLCLEKNCTEIYIYITYIHIHI